MRPHTTTRYRLFASLVLLLHLLAAILPASTRPVSAQGNDCNGEIVEVTSAALAVPLDPDQDVVIPKDTVDLSVFQANWRLAYQNAEAVESLMLDEFMIRAGTPNTNLEQVMDDFRKEYEKAIPPEAILYRSVYPYDEIIHTMLDVALKNPELAPHVPAVWKHISDADLFNRLGGSATTIAQSANRYGLGERLINLAPEILKKVRDCAQKKPEVAQVFDKHHRAKLKTSIRDSAKTMIEKNSNLAILIDIQNRLQVDGTINISINELKELSVNEFGKLHAAIDDMQKTLVEIDKKQDVIIDYIKNQQEMEKTQELAKKKAEENKLKLDAIQSSLSIISTIVGQLDPKLGKQISVVGASSVKVGLAVHGWLKAVSGLSTLNKVFSLSTVVMTGDVLGAVMNVIGLFGANQPTPEQMILEEIGKLRQQVDQLRTEMHDRFDRIDQGLNAIYTTMHERFDQIDIQLGKINGNILEVHQSLIEIDLKLSRIERNNFELLNAVERRPLIEAINGLGYRKRTGTPMSNDKFDEIENRFHAWATLSAFDPGNVGPSQRDYSDVGLLIELTTYPLDVNLNYINGWLVRNGLPAIANHPLPSPRDWLLASRAYTQLGLEEPEQMANIIRRDPQRQAKLTEIGVELENAMHNLSTLATVTGTVGNNLLFSTVISHYQNKLATLESEILKQETTFLTGVRNSHKRENQPAEALFSLYAGIDQPLTYQTSEVSTITCSGTNEHGSYPATSNLRSLIPNFERYNLADYLRLGKISVCLSDEWINQQDICRTDPEPPYSEICDTYGQFTAVLTVYFDTISLMRQSIAETEFRICCGSGADTRFYWTDHKNYKAQFEALPSVDPPSPELAAQRANLLNTITLKLETLLESNQHQLYDQVTSAMVQGTLKEQSTMIAGSKMLLESLVTLGLPRAVSADEFVHAMLFGNQQLVDDRQILRTYTLSATQPITGANLLINPRLVIGQVANERSTAFTGMINQYLNAISGETHVEAPDYIANTRRALDLTLRIVSLSGQPSPAPTPTPGATKQVYLPFVGR